MRATSDPTPIRDAATVVLVRRVAGVPQVLMGQRGGTAAFMPNLFVFPGGAVDADDLALPGDPPLTGPTARRLALETRPEVARALPRAAIRELWEETGLLLGRPAAPPAVPAPASWQGFCELGLEPHTAALQFFFRAITPPGRPRRFDARFFLAEATALAGEEREPSGDELAHLQWLALHEARDLPLPFVTEVVLSEVQALLEDPDPDRPVPFFRQSPEGPRFSLL